MSLKKKKIITQLFSSKVRIRQSILKLPETKSIQLTENDEKWIGKSKCCGHKMAPVEAAKMKKIVGFQLIYKVK